VPEVVWAQAQRHRPHIFDLPNPPFARVGPQRPPRPAMAALSRLMPLRAGETQALQFVPGLARPIRPHLKRHKSIFGELEWPLSYTLPIVELLRYQREDGREPFTEWSDAVRDRTAQACIRVRLRQVEAGELRRQRAGRRRPDRVACTSWRYGPAVVLLLSGGDNSSKVTDIKQSKVAWRQ
jgi:putative component of toxin-antitoxin plasmid stabilization module